MARSKNASASADRPAKCSSTPTMLCPSAKFGLNAMRFRVGERREGRSSLRRFHDRVMASDHSAYGYRSSS